MEIGQKTLFHHVLMIGVAVVGEGFDGNAPTGIEQADNLQIFWVHQFDKVLHDDVHTVLVKVAMVAEAEEVKLKAFTLHHQGARDIINNKVSEIRLARFGTQRSELRTVQRHQIIVFGMLVLKHLQHLGRIVVTVVGVLVPQQRHAFQLLFVS